MVWISYFTGRMSMHCLQDIHTVASAYISLTQDIPEFSHTSMLFLLQFLLSLIVGLSLMHADLRMHY